MTDVGLWSGQGGPHQGSLHRVQLGQELCVVSGPCPHGLQSRETYQGLVLGHRQH